MKFWKLAILLTFPLMGMAQINGTVYGIENGQKTSLPSANVYWEGSQKGTTTDSSGQFTIDPIPGKNTLVASFIGFKPQQKIIISQTGQTDFVLYPEGEELEDVTVTGRAEATQVNARKAELSYRIDDQELRKAACCNLSESFETNASVDVSFSDAITGTRQIEMLGLAGKYALIQRENMPYARGLNATSGLTYIPGPFIESIQLTKGLSSVLNGYESLTGQINVEFFKPETAPRFLVNAFGNQGGRMEVNLLASSKWSESLRNTTMLHANTIPFAQDKNGDNFADIPNGHQLNLTTRSHFKRQNGWEGQVGVNAISELKRGGQIAFVNEKPADSLWGFQSEDQRLEIFGKNGYVFKDNPFHSFGLIYSASYQEKSARFGERHYRGQQNNLYLNTIYQNILGDSRHKFRTGLSLLAENVNERLDSSSENAIYQSERQEIVPGGYFEYTFEPNTRFTLVSGLRADYNSYFERLYITPRINLRYAVSDLTTLRLGGGRGQRTPNVVAENYNALASARSLFFANNIAPEIGWNSGFSLDQFIPLGKRQIHFTADVFYTWFENKLITDLDRNPLRAYFLNQQGSRFLSFMIQADYKWFTGFESRLAYKYLNAQEQFSKGLNWSYQTPMHRAFVNLNYQTSDDWKFDGTVNWFGAKRQPNTQESPDQFQRDGWSPGFFTVNLQVNKVLNQFELFMGVDNLLNFRQANPIVNAQNPGQPYFDSNFNWGPIFGRMIYAGLYYSIE